MPLRTKLDLSKAIGFVVNRTAYLMRQAAGETFERIGVDLTPEELALLVHLWQSDGQTQKELAGCTIRDRTTVTRILDGMSKKGLVRRETGRRDRRMVRTWLTRAGKRLERVILPAARDRLREATRGISDADLQITLASLRKVQENIQSMKKSGGAGNGKAPN